MHQFQPFAGLGDLDLLRLQSDASELRGGVFAVHACTSPKPNTPNFVGVDRVLGTDPLGTLFIGWSEDLLDLAAALADRRPHAGDAGFLAVYQHHSGLRTRFPLESLGVSFLFREAPQAAAVQQLATYQATFGEFPPLNETL